MDETVMKRKALFKIFSKKTNTKYLEKKKFIASGAQGNVFRYCLSKSGDQVKKCVAVKVSYIDERESKYIADVYSPKALSSNVFIECAAVQLVNQLVLQKISPHFILNYRHLIKERIGACRESYPNKAILYNELIEEGSTFNAWVREGHSISHFYNAYFQIITAVYAMQKYFKMMHLDLHSKNILVKKVPKGGYWKYRIGEHEYFVPNLGYIFYINDFDQVWIPNKFKSWFIRQRYSKKSIHKGFDIMFLFRSTLGFTTSPKEFRKDIRKAIKGLKNNAHFETIIHDLWGEKYQEDNLWKHGKQRQLIETYDLNKTFKATSLVQELRFIVE